MIHETPLGSFTYRKKLGARGRQPASVEVFALRVEKQRKNWKERGERRFKWVDVPAALGLVEHPGLATLFQTLVEIHGQAQDYAYLTA